MSQTSGILSALRQKSFAFACLKKKTPLASAAAASHSSNRANVATTSFACSESTTQSGEADKAAIMKGQLKKSFPDARVEVQDVSGGCGSAYEVVVDGATAFQGKPLVRQHRMVKEVLKEHFAQLHAMRVFTKPKAA